jgi:hypothetical protein
MLIDSSQKAIWLVLVFANNQTRTTKKTIGRQLAPNPSVLFIWNTVNPYFRLFRQVDREES